jgi:hypothetical protein
MAHTTTIPRTTTTAGRSSTPLLWTGQAIAGAILGLGALVKFFNYTPEGSMALATALGVGRGTVTAIGAIELLAAALVLVPRTRVWGALLAGGTMAGALFSHATQIGWSGDAAADMWPLAIIGLAASGGALYASRKELPLGLSR